MIKKELTTRIFNVILIQSEAMSGRQQCFALAALLPILQQPYHLENLQCRDRKAGFERRRAITIHNWPSALQTDDCDHAAGLVGELDLVLAVSTSVVPLAGALGTPSVAGVYEFVRFFCVCAATRHTDGNA